MLSCDGVSTVIGATGAGDKTRPRGHSDKDFLCDLVTLPQEAPQQSGVSSYTQSKLHSYHNIINQIHSVEFRILFINIHLCRRDAS